ncbi:MAG TPA: hypothetical protein VFA28_05275 [Bryobacteraceae bacterium]|nr:hypothetical protein [Bryobacteraceae bacterium]
MPKHAPELMRPETFELAVDLQKRRVAFWLAHPGKTHPLKRIHELLVQYWSLPKSMIVSRHDLMRRIIAAGNAYIRSKNPKKTNSEKVQAVCVLVWQANERLRVETFRAQQLEKRINAPTNNVKVVGGYGNAMRYERVAKPGGVAVTGVELYEEAQKGTLGNIELTGNDLNDFYALKKLLKNLTPQQILDAGLKVLEYADDDLRAQYAVYVGKNKFKWDETNMPIDTQGCTYGDPPRSALYAADLGGNFYCRVYDQTLENRGWFAHSSFLAGENALCAGTMKIRYGRLIEISNLSGHYQPRREHLADACTAILEHGYDPMADGYALLADKAMQFPLTSNRNTGYYRFPLALFARSKGVVPNYMDFEVRPEANGYFRYTNPAAARNRGCQEEP